MTIREVTYTDAPGGTFYAYPERTSNTYSLANWTTHRVQLIESDKLEDGGIYQGSVDDDKGAVWFIFEGAAQPSDWGQAVAVVDFTGEQISTNAATAATEIGKVHRSATAVAAGASMRRTAVTDTATTLDETLGPTP